jgi:hypothetical protein
MGIFLSAHWIMRASQSFFIAKKFPDAIVHALKKGGCVQNHEVVTECVSVHKSAPFRIVQFPFTQLLFRQT